MSGFNMLGVVDNDHVPLDIGTPVGFSKNPAKVIVKLHLKVEHNGGLSYLSFIAENVGAHRTVRSDPKGSKNKCICIDEDTEITFILSGDWAWSWPDSVSAFSTKKAYTDKHGHNYYGHIEGVVVRPNETRKDMTLYARKVEGDSNQHSFNFVIMMQDWSGMPGRWIPFIIDPEVKNPPINQPLTAPSEGLVPLLGVD